MGSSLSLVAALMAYLISYEEYRKHFYDKKKPIIMSLQSAGLILAFFLVISLIAAFIFSNPAFMR
jgi:uncharacterized membrane-anchored protein